MPEGTLEKLREALDKGERISVRCPVTVRPKKSEPVQSWFDVHLEVPEDLDRSEEAFIRRDLLIGGEGYPARARRIGTRRSSPSRAARRLARTWSCADR